MNVTEVVHQLIFDKQKLEKEIESIINEFRNKYPNTYPDINAIYDHIEKDGKTISYMLRVKVNVII